MNGFEIISGMENQVARIERGRAVLAEVGGYFSQNDELKFLPRYAGHIELLLQVVNDLLFGASEDLKDITDRLLKKHKEEREKGIGEK